MHFEKQPKQKKKYIEKYQQIVLEEKPPEVPVAIPEEQLTSRRKEIVKTLEQRK